MGKVLRFHGHHWYRCAPGCNDGHGCMTCNGGLSSCTVCGGAEASLPTDCPGRRMSLREQADVQAGRLDYRVGQGWHVPGSLPRWPPGTLSGL